MLGVIEVVEMGNAWESQFAEKDGWHLGCDPGSRAVTFVGHHIPFSLYTLFTLSTVRRKVNGH